jgi:anti-anti-sigma factor
VTADGFGYELDEERKGLLVHGELDADAYLELRRAIENASGDHTSDLAIDVAGVTFMPSIAIGVLAAAEAASRRNFRTITLVAPPGSVAQPLPTICAIDHVPTLEV